MSRSVTWRFLTVLHLNLINVPWPTPHTRAGSRRTSLALVHRELRHTPSRSPVGCRGGIALRRRVGASPSTASRERAGVGAQLVGDQRLVPPLIQQQSSSAQAI